MEITPQEETESEAEFELISDQEMYDFVERVKRGGVSTIITRYAKASKQVLHWKYPW